MRETTDTSGYALFPKGHYKFVVTEEPQKYKTSNGKIGYIFEFETINERGEKKIFKERFIIWLIGDLLRALKCQEVQKDKFDWDTVEVVGREIEADIAHEPDAKDPTKKWARMRNITEAMPF